MQKNFVYFNANFKTKFWNKFCRKYFSEKKILKNFVHKLWKKEICRKNLKKNREQILVKKLQKQFL